MNHIDIWHDAKKARSAARAKWMRNNRGIQIIDRSNEDRMFMSLSRSMAARKKIKPTLATVKFGTAT